MCHPLNLQRPGADGRKGIYYKTFGDFLLRIMMDQMESLCRRHGYPSSLCRAALVRSQENELLTKVARFLGLDEFWFGKNSVDVRETGNMMECLLFVVADKSAEAKEEYVCLLFYLCIFIFSIAFEDARWDQ